MKHMKLIFATNNQHKLEEARAILPAFTIISLAELGCHEEIPETQPTLEGNSLQKANFVKDWCAAHSSSLPSDLYGCFADDTGLEIEALHGAPGVYTARWSGEHCNPADNRKKALAELEGITHRDARFRTVVTLIPFAQGAFAPLSSTQSSAPHSSSTQGAPAVFEGIVRGAIATEERGTGGFGYDAVFIPEGYQHTFAELPIELKNSISHRARAMQQLAEHLKKYTK